MADTAPTDLPVQGAAKPPLATKKLKSAPIDPAVLEVRRRYREDGGITLNEQERTLLVSSLPLFAE